MASVGYIATRKGYDGGKPTIEKTYQVNVETANDADAAISAVESLSDPSGYRVKAIHAEHINRNPLWFKVKVTYEWRTIDTGGGGTQSDDPLDRPSILSGSYDTWTEDYFIDKGEPPLPVTNSAGDRFDPLPQRKSGSLVLQITKNFSSYDARAYDAIKFTTNESAVTIKGTTYGANILLFLPPAGQEVYEHVGTTEFHYFAVTFRLAVDAGEHKVDISDRGYKQVVDGKSVRILDGNNQPVETPWPLDGFGHALTSAQISRGTKPATLTIIPYASKSWGIDFS